MRLEIDQDNRHVSHVSGVMCVDRCASAAPPHNFITLNKETLLGLLLAPGKYQIGSGGELILQTKCIRWQQKSAFFWMSQTRILMHLMP